MKLKDLLIEKEALNEGALVKIATKIEAVFKKAFTNKEEPESILLCVDNSGSMGGSDIPGALKQAMTSSTKVIQTLLKAEKDDSLFGMMTLTSKLFSVKTANAWRKEVKSIGNSYAGGSDFSLFKQRAKKFNRAILITDDDADYGETKKQLSGIRNLTIIKV